jgi:hypothetical protein
MCYSACLQGVVRDFARQMGSISTLVRDATLPLLSYFSGAAFEEALQRSFSQGPGGCSEACILGAGNAAYTRDPYIYGQCALP